MNVMLTHAYYLEEDSRELKIMKPYVPLGILYISSYLDNAGIENIFVDSTFISFDRHCEKILESKPDVIGIYTNLMTRKNVLKLISFIRNAPSVSHSKIVLGGPEVRYHAENFLKSGADFIVNGEGESAMAELATALSSNGSIDKIKLIHGLVFLDQGVPVFTPERTAIRDLDTLPLPAREKADMQRYYSVWKTHHGESAVSVNTMRGCPYTCRWCSRAVYGQSYRRRSPKKVVEEIQHIMQNYPADSIWFVDDVFTISHKWLREFYEHLTAAGVKIRYECITRADRMNTEVIGLLKKTGCYRVWIGAESGSQKVIDAMDRRVDVSQVRNMIVKSRESGLQAGTFIMLGYPGETEKDILETLSHLKSSDPDYYTITVAYPITGTPFHSETIHDLPGLEAWARTTDRELDFKRTYSRKYYVFAIRWISNEMAWHKSRRQTSLSPITLLHKCKALLSRGGMLLNRN